MSPVVQLLVGSGLFLLGMRLSAFFSGVETGFYRVSQLRLGIDADRGDPRAVLLSWFARNPGHFVATTLVGNNLANYATTAGIGIGAPAVVVGDAGGVEIVATLLVTPVVFVFGELVPKNLFFRAPFALLHRATPLFGFFYRLLLPVSLPLVLLARLFERLSGSANQVDALLGRSRLVHALSQGHEHGILTDAQDRLAHGVLAAASQPLREAMTPVTRALGVKLETPTDEALGYAARFGTTHLVVRRGESPDCIGYVRVADLAISGKSVSDLLRPLPVVEPSASKLDALAVLHESGETRGLVVDGDRQLGIVTEQGLVEQLFRAGSVIRTAGAASA